MTTVTTVHVGRLRGSLGGEACLVDIGYLERTCDGCSPALGSHLVLSASCWPCEERLPHVPSAIYSLPQGLKSLNPQAKINFLSYLC